MTLCVERAPGTVHFLEVRGFGRFGLVGRMLAFFGAGLSRTADLEPTFSEEDGLTLGMAGVGGPAANRL